MWHALLFPPKVSNLRRVRGLGGVGLAIDVTMESDGKTYELTAFKMGSDGRWHWLHDGTLAPYEVMNLWMAHQAKNLLDGKPAYTIESRDDAGGKKQ